MCSFGKNSVLYDILCNKALSDEDFMPTSAYNYMGSAKERIRLIYPDNPICHEMDRNSSLSSSSSNEGDGSRRFGLKLTTSSSQQQNKRTTSATDLDDNGQSVFTCSI